jgi:hypothetical protein
MAKKLSLSSKTVEMHRTNIKREGQILGFSAKKIFYGLINYGVSESYICHELSKECSLYPLTKAEVKVFSELEKGEDT